MRRDRIFRHDQRKRSLSFLHAGLCLSHNRGDFGFIRRKRQPRNLKGVEQLVHDLAHLLMLRLVFYPGLAAPGHDEQRRNLKWIIERRERVDHVSKPRVLAHRHRFSPGQGRSEGDPDRLALARRADVIERRIVDDVIEK
jgi:hypothetical protein